MRVGIIGGSGLYDIERLGNVEHISVKTPFGDPSDKFVKGILDGVEFVFLPRHGKGHRLIPSEIPFRANIYGFKVLGIERIISLSAVGSLREEITPGDAVIIDQFLDRTKGRTSESTFFGDGCVGHIAFADPICSDLSTILSKAAKSAGWNLHNGGTYICMEGPAFSTKAESNFHRMIGGSVIGMTNLQEAKLAREAELCYATLALSTDFDCWKDEHVSIEEILKVVGSNVKKAKLTIEKLAPLILANLERACNCSKTLEGCIITSPDMIPSKLKEDLAPIIGKYIK